MKRQRESNINVWFQIMSSLASLFPKQIMMSCLPVSTFMYVWTIYIFPESGCLNCSQIHECRNRERGRVVSFLGTYKSDCRYSAGWKLLLSHPSVTLFSGQFEYPDLNGRLRPSQAETLCNADPGCGAFTYKVRFFYEFSPFTFSIAKYVLVFWHTVFCFCR